MDQIRRISRTELYEKVWNAPMRTLATEFGLSDVGLAKICRKNGIPLPGLGYWRLVETGHAPKRQPLPAIQSGQKEEIRFSVHERTHYERIASEEKGPILEIRVGDTREITHPLVIRTRKLFQSISKQNDGSISPRELKAPHLEVSSEVLGRALRILDALFFAIEEQGHSITWPSEEKTSLRIVVDGENIVPNLSEIFERKPHVFTPRELAERKKYQYSYAPSWDFEPSGKLCLGIENLPYELTHVRKSWSDAKRQTVESCLGAFVAKLVPIAKAIKLVREERERERLRRIEEEKRPEEQRIRREKYNRRSQVVTKFLQGWQQSENLRLLAAAINKQLEDSTPDNDEKQMIREIAEWISTHADDTDPLLHFNWMIRQFNDPPYQY
jgi:hypothetical protein